MTTFPLTIELRHLRYFLVAAEHGSFRRASIVLGIQESSISRRIRDLEDQLGVSLFQRYNGGVRLTIAGNRFQTRVEAIFGQLSEGIVSLSSISRGMDGRIRIGLVAPITNGFPAELLREFSRKHKSVHIELVDGESLMHINAVRHFDLDIAFVPGTRPWCGCDATPLWSERLFALLPENHPLSDQTELSWIDLVSEPFIIAGTALGKELRALVTTRLVDLGHIPNLQSQSVSCSNLAPLVSLGRGVLLIVGAMAEVQCPGVILRPILNETLMLSAVWSPHNDNPAFRRFLSMAKRLSVICGGSQRQIM